jgi:hypothetical protein
MAKQIIILGAAAENIMLNVSCAFWFPITSGAKAQVSGSVWASASVAENTAIQNGSVQEEQATFSFPVGLATANIKAFLLQYWTNRNARINGVGQALYAGVFDDSVSSWSA